MSEPTGSHHKRDLTVDSIPRQMIAFALPMLAGAILMMTYNRPLDRLQLKNYQGAFPWVDYSTLADFRNGLYCCFGGTNRDAEMDALQFQPKCEDLSGS